MYTLNQLSNYRTDCTLLFTCEIRDFDNKGGKIRDIQTRANSGRFLQQKVHLCKVAIDVCSMQPTEYSTWSLSVLGWWWIPILGTRYRWCASIESPFRQFMPLGSFHKTCYNAHDVHCGRAMVHW